MKSFIGMLKKLPGVLWEMMNDPRPLRVQLTDIIDDENAAKV